MVLSVSLENRGSGQKQDGNEWNPGWTLGQALVSENHSLSVYREPHGQWILLRRGQETSMKHTCSRKLSSPSGPEGGCMSVGAGGAEGRGGAPVDKDIDFGTKGFQQEGRKEAIMVLSFKDMAF